jgi:hypothetical protein
VLTLSSLAVLPLCSSDYSQSLLQSAILMYNITATVRVCHFACVSALSVRARDTHTCKKFNLVNRWITTN